MTTSAKPAIIDRSEPIFGVCEALGDDFGISGHWFRAALAPVLLFNPLAAVGCYVALGVLVVAARIVFPDRRLSGEAAQSAESVDAITLPTAAEDQPEQIALAA